MFFSSVKEMNRLISKGMLNIYYWQKPTFSKLWFSQKKNALERNPLALKSKKVKGLFKETFILALSSSAVFHLKNHVSDFLPFVLLRR